MTSSCRHRAYLHVVVFGVVANNLPVEAGTFHVDASATTGLADGSSWCNGYTNLQDALMAASSGDVVRVANGTYKPDQGGAVVGGDRLATFRLPSGVAAYGGFAGCGASDPDARDYTSFETILSGDLSNDDAAGFANRDDNAYHVMTYDDPAATNVIVDGFTISGGYSDGTGPAGTITNQGPAIHIRFGSQMCMAGGPTIRNCIVEDNWSSHHGAINIHANDAVIEGCTIRNNYAGVRGGGLLIQSGSATVRRCTFTNNRTDGDGGGAWTGHNSDPSCATSSKPTFEDCLFSGNSAKYSGGVTGNGGGLFNELNSPTIARCTYQNNDADVRGGGLHDNGTLNMLLVDSVFTGNISMGHDDSVGSGNGGGAWMGFGTQTVSRCTFSENVSRLYGGGLSIQDASARIEDCQFTANRTTVARGGGIRTLRGTTDIVRCLFDTNEVLNGGAALQIEGGAEVILFNSIFRRNRTNWGSAISMSGSRATVANCLFVRHPNVVRGVGATILFANCTFAGNLNNPGATARFHSINSQTPSHADFVNCIVWNNTDDVVNEDGSQVSFTNSNVLAGWPGQGNFTMDPEFIDASGPDGIMGTADDDFSLSENSTSRNAGDTGAWLADLADLDGDGDRTEPTPFDLAGAPRVSGTSIDLGAYETAFGPCPPGTSSANGQEPCEPCSIGQFQPNSGGTVCSPCPAGTFISTTGSAICNPCPLGTFQPNIGSAICMSCGCEDQDECTLGACDATTGDCQIEPITGCAISAASTWGLISMALLLLSVGTIRIPHYHAEPTGTSTARRSSE